MPYLTLYVNFKSERDRLTLQKVILIFESNESLSNLILLGYAIANPTYWTKIRHKS